MDLNDTSQSSNKNVKYFGQKLVESFTAYNAADETVDKTYSESVSNDGITSVSSLQRNSYLQNETNFLKINEVWHCFNAFQRSINDVDKKDKSLSGASNEHPLVIESTIDGTTSLKLKNRQFSDLEHRKQQIHHNIFSEDDDWDIYQPGFYIKSNSIESALESHFVNERCRLKSEKCLPNNIASSIDSGTSQPTSFDSLAPSNCSNTTLVTNYRKWNEERMLKEVKAFFLENPVKVTRGNLIDSEYKKWIQTSPYFSKKFAVKYGLPFNNFPPGEENSLFRDLMKEIKSIQVSVNAHMNTEYEKQQTKYLKHVQSRERYLRFRKRILAENGGIATSGVISKDISNCQMVMDSFPRTTNEEHIIKSFGLNTSNDNSCNADEVKVLHENLKCSASLTDSFKGESEQSNDILIADIDKRSSFVESTNQENEKI